MPSAGPDPQFLMPAPLAATVREALPGVAERVIAQIVRDVPSYSEAWSGRMLRTIETAVALAITGFVDMAAGTSEGTGITHDQMRSAAYELGKGEARAGRSMDALASAYRIGTSRAWRDLSRIAGEADLPAAEMARFAERVFDYLDELSAQSVAGHADELARVGRLRDRHLAELSTALIAGRPEERLVRLAEQAEWRVPHSLTAILLPQSVARSTRSRLDPRTLEVGSEIAELEAWPEHAVLLTPGRARGPLLAALAGTEGAVVGPTLAWSRARDSFRRALRVLEIDLPVDGVLDSDHHLADLIVRSDDDARAALRAQVLAPLADLRPAAAEKLTETLRAWLLHQGRRDDIAAALFVHPQTIRYRMGQLRDAFGDRLEDPTFVRDATIALA